MRSISRLFSSYSGGQSKNVMRGITVLAFGSGIARLFGVLSIPVIARIYSPDDMGVLAVFVAVVGILAPMATLRYAQTLPLPGSDTAAMNILALSMLLIGVSFLLVLALLQIVGGPLLSLLSMEVLQPWRWLVAFGVAATASYELMTFWATRRRAYTIIAVTSVWQGAAGAMAKIGFGLLTWHPAGLLIGQVIGQSGGMGKMLRQFGRDFHTMAPRVSWSRMRGQAWRYRSFPIYRVPSQFLMMFSIQSPILFCSAMFDANVTGQLSLAIMALTLPINIIGTSAGQALYSEAAQILKRDPKRISEMAKDVQWRLFLIGLAPTVILFFVGDKIFILFFGETWSMAGQFASILSVSLLFQFTSSPLVQLLNIVPQQAIYLALNAARAIILLVTFAASWFWQLDPIEFILVYSVVMVVFYILVSIAVIRLVSTLSNERPPK